MGEAVEGYKNFSKNEQESEDTQYWGRGRATGPLMHCRWTRELGQRWTTGNVCSG